MFIVEMSPSFSDPLVDQIKPYYNMRYHSCTKGNNLHLIFFALPFLFLRLTPFPVQSHTLPKVLLVVIFDTRYFILVIHY